MDPTVLGLAVAAGGTAAGGAGMLLRRVAMPSGLLLLLAGACGLVAATQLDAGRGHLGVVLVTIGGNLLGATALVTFPRPVWRHLVDFLALVSVTGLGAVCVVETSAHQMGALGGLGLAQACLVIAHTWWRVEVADHATRRALLWMVLAVCVSTLVFFFVSFSSGGEEFGTPASLSIAVLGAVGPAMYVGATLPDLVDVRALVVRSVVITVALVTVLAVFVLEVGLLDALGADRLSVGAQGLLAGLAATTYHPVSVVLRGVVDQILFGQRPDPLGAASSVAGRIGDDPVVALQAIREALVIPYAALLVGDETVAVSGVETTHVSSRDLAGIGTLVLGLRPADLSFGSDDEQVLRLVVPLLTQTLQARALAAQVLESSGQAIAAVAEERRRLRRDLHDGLGPRLSGVAFTSDAVRNLIRTDPDAAEALLIQLRADTGTAIAEIRQLVYAMRPPALDELGLVPALRQRSNNLRNREGQVVLVDVTSVGPLPALPAAVEVAAYRIVTEALTNVARHSSSLSASVCLAPQPDGLRIEVTDSGRSRSWRPGVGLTSMRERATELGGSLEAGPGPGGGRVSALLPL